MFACVHHVAHTELLLHSSAFCLRAYTNERNTRHLMLFYSRILLGTHPSFRRKQQLLILTSPPPAPRERTCARWPGDIEAANDKFDRFYIFIYSRMHFHFFFFLSKIAAVRSCLNVHIRFHRTLRSMQTESKGSKYCDCWLVIMICFLIFSLYTKIDDMEKNPVHSVHSTTQTWLH